MSKKEEQLKGDKEKLEDTGHPSGKDHAKKDKKKKEDGDEAAAVLQSKLNELNDKYLRLYSEFDNYRKRTLKERIELSKTASEEVILSLLPVIDDLERALAATVQSGDGSAAVPAEGLQLIYQKFIGLLAQKGLEMIPAKGETFDVDFHHALTNIPAPSEELKGKVVDEIEKGYTLNGKVIRFSKVVVGQ